jgi:hypothetical protein
VNNIGNADVEGISAPYVVPSSPNCATLGRLPWRTLGIDKLRDSASEPLWYAVSPNWRLQNSSTSLVINSNTRGQLVVDGVAAPNDVVALIIAPGPAMNAAAAAGCAPRQQTRAAPAPGMDPLDYVECLNLATSAFATTGPSTSFNDETLAITTADVLPAIEAAIASRFEREIAPAMRSAYSNGYAANPNPAWGATNPVLPFAAPFQDPSSPASFEGEDGRYRGLLPFVRGHAPCSCTPAGNCECTPAACTGTNDCDPQFVRFTGGDPTMSGTDVYNATCTRGNTQIDCQFYVRVPLLGSPPSSVDFTINDISVRRVGRALRQFHPQAPMPGVRMNGRTLTGVLNGDNTATLTLNAQADTADLTGGLFLNRLLCGIGGLLSLTMGCQLDSISIPHTIMVDHAVLDDNHASLGWFHRNQWHNVAYYAIAQPIAPGGSGACLAPPAAASSVCLAVDYLPTTGKQRGLIVLSGRSLTNPAGRPNGTLSDWLEGENATSGGISASVYGVRDPLLRINRTFNDRVAVIDQNP